MAGKDAKFLNQLVEYPARCCGILEQKYWSSMCWKDRVMKLQVILALEIYDMVVYKKCLNTKIEVHMKSSSWWN